MRAAQECDPAFLATGRDRRQFARVALDAQVVVAVDDAVGLFESRIRDLSENGVFIVSTSTRPIGTTVKLRVTLQERGLEFRAEGIIVHEVRQDDASLRPNGFGVMFVRVYDESALLEMMALGERL